MTKKHEEIMAQLEAVKTERFREEKLRQSIRENSSELRDLEQKLNYAYMNKERALQLKERELLLKKEKVIHKCHFILSM
jgi:oligoendopeptidase F